MTIKDGLRKGLRLLGGATGGIAGLKLHAMITAPKILPKLTFLNGSPRLAAFVGDSALVGQVVVGTGLGVGVGAFAGGLISG